VYLLPIYEFSKQSVLQIQDQDEIISKDIEDEVFNKAVDDSLRANNTSRKRIIDAAKRLEQLGYPEDKISTKIRYEANRRGCTDDYLDYISKVLSQTNPLWTDKKFAGSHVRTSENLENLNRTVGEHTFDDLRTSSTDTIPQIAKYDLTDTQYNKLSAAEQQQYHDVRKKLFSQQKATINHQSTNYETKAEERGVMSQEQANKKSTIIPPKQLWGKSDTYDYINTMAEKYDTISKYLRDVAKQVYVFKLEPKLDKEALKLFQSYHDERMVPLWETSLIGAEEIISILENVQDEKNRDTALGWMKKGMDKHWSYGNHGTGEVDFIQTGEFIYRLDKEQITNKDGEVIKTIPVVIKVPIKRETTREQIGDKTTVKLLDKDNQLQIVCPECKLEFNKPIVGDEERDIFAGDLFYKAANLLRGNKLSQAIETICDNVIYVKHQTPQEFFIQEMKRRGVKDPTVPKNLKVKTDKPEKIKTIDLTGMSRAEIGYNIYWGRAHRTADKSEWFSIQS